MVRLYTVLLQNSHPLITNSLSAMPLPQICKRNSSFTEVHRRRKGKEEEGGCRDKYAQPCPASHHNAFHQPRHTGRGCSRHTHAHHGSSTATPPRLKQKQTQIPVQWCCMSAPMSAEMRRLPNGRMQLPEKHSVITHVMPESQERHHATMPVFTTGPPVILSKPCFHVLFPVNVPYVQTKTQEKVVRIRMSCDKI